VKLAGTDEERIVSEAVRLLEDRDEHTRMTRVHNPYGVGAPAVGSRQRYRVSFAGLPRPRNVDSDPRRWPTVSRC
jgi:hypothetical protein